MMRQIINWKLQLRGQLRIYTEFPFNFLYEKGKTINRNKITFL